MLCQNTSYGINGGVGVVGMWDVYQLVLKFATAIVDNNKCRVCRVYLNLRKSPLQLEPSYPGL